ncbi:MAG: YbaB/EbfC family nucleoid-associated protein [Lachnospiraceae bacterium]|nr:YbaB/EbfC family nucleoid-associated protein [Lachnospiraceae bacterium]
MAKRSGGFGGGMPGNMQNLMKQAQKMQRQMEESQKALEESEFTSQIGGGAVKLSMNGKRQINSLKIDPDAVDPEDVETLEEMITAAFADVLKQIDDAQGASVGALGSAMGGLGGGLGGLF